MFDLLKRHLFIKLTSILVKVILGLIQRENSIFSEQKNKAFSLSKTQVKLYNLTFK